MRPSILRCPPMLGRPAFLAAALLWSAPALAQGAAFTDIPSPTFELDRTPAVHPAKGASRKARPAKAATSPAADGTAAPGTIPMDFSGMARRGADLDRDKEMPTGDNSRPVLHNGTMPGATFKF